MNAIACMQLLYYTTVFNIIIINNYLCTGGLLNKTQISKSERLENLMNYMIKAEKLCWAKADHDYYWNLALNWLKMTI